MPIIYAVLADPSHTLPIPGQPGSFFPVKGRRVDLDDPFWHAVHLDGSIVAADEPTDAADEPTDAAAASTGESGPDEHLEPDPYGASHG